MSCLQMCTIEWLILQSFKTYRTYCSRNQNSLIFYPICTNVVHGIKKSDICVCSSWCTLICTSFWNILTFTSGKELFWRVYFLYLGRFLKKYIGRRTMLFNTDSQKESRSLYSWSQSNPMTLCQKNNSTFRVTMTPHWSQAASTPSLGSHWFMTLC